MTRQPPLAATMLVTALAALAGCKDEPPPTGTLSGPLVVTLATPALDDGAILVRVAGGPVAGAVPTSSQHVFYYRETGAMSISAVVAGDLQSGALFEVEIPDGADPSAYQATILEVSDRESELRADLSGYALTLAAR